MTVETIDGQICIDFWEGISYAPSLENMYEVLTANCVSCITAGTLLVIKGIGFFQTLTDIMVHDLNTPKARIVFAEAGSATDLSGHLITCSSGFKAGKVRFPTKREWRTYKAFKTI